MSWPDGFGLFVRELLEEKTRELFEDAVCGDVEGWRPAGMLAALERGEVGAGARLRALAAAEAEALPAPRIRYSGSAAELVRCRQPGWATVTEGYAVTPGYLRDSLPTDWVAIFDRYRTWTW